MATPPIPQVTLEQFETAYRDRHLLHRAIDWWAARTPGDAAVVNATRGTTLTWRELERSSMAIAAELARMGFRHGDYLAASLPLLNEHILLELACFRLGVIHAPLDLRLQPAEVDPLPEPDPAERIFLPRQDARGRFCGDGRGRTRAVRFHRAPGSMLARRRVHCGRYQPIRPAGARASRNVRIARDRA
jgi:hypothetical protein